MNTAEVDNRVKRYVEMEDPDIVCDLRELQLGRASKFDCFWSECTKFLQDVGLAVDERRHTQVTHIARALSVRDLQEQVSRRCPPSTPIPSRSLQFWPKNAHAHSSIHYTGCFSVKYMVQARQFRKDHVDSHYGAAVFRYQREFAVQFRDNSAFVSMDDKHKIKVSKPNNPVAAAERGRRVMVGRNQTFQVSDHFTRFSLTPSVSLVIDIPDDITGSWYRGQVLIGLKEGAFEPSSPLRHVTELHDAFQKHKLFPPDKSILFLHCDGGPDHRLTYLSVKLSLISLFLKLDLDFLCACRTAPYHLWRNPAERVMSIINMGLQCVGVMRSAMTDTDEAQIAGCNSLSVLRSQAKRQPDIIPAIKESVEPAKLLLYDIFERLVLQGQNFKTFSAASDEMMREMWSELSHVDPLLEYGTVYRQAALKELPQLAAFLDHCCHSRHYSFCIKKCGEQSCTFCKPVRMPLDFLQIHHLPDPVPGSDGHYSPFTDVYGTTMTEQHRPSLQQIPKRHKILPFSAGVQHVKNVDIMVQCEECEMWRLVYSRYKLTKVERGYSMHSMKLCTHVEPNYKILTCARVRVVVI